MQIPTKDTSRTYTILIVVLLILGVVGSRGCRKFVRNFRNFPEKLDNAKIRATRKRVNGLHTAAHIYRKEKVQLPPSGNGNLVAVLQENRMYDFPPGSVNRKGEVVDMWSRPLIYIAPGKIHAGSFDLYSIGPDGRDDGGGGDDIANE